MSEPYLILHKVRGQPAFDIAEQLRCPICEPVRQGLDDGSYCDCNACEGESFWWIIPTSGHRAYPYVWQELSKYRGVFEGGPLDCVTARAALNLFPTDWPDHYPTTSSPHTPNPSALSLAERLGLVPKAVVITRRL